MQHKYGISRSQNGHQTTLDILMKQKGRHEHSHHASIEDLI